MANVLDLHAMADDLTALCGAEHVHVEEDCLHVEPKSEEEVSALLRYASKNRLGVTPSGGGTKIGWGNPVGAGIALSLQRLNAIREHTWQDMTCTVEAGCNWANMQASLAAHGQFVALDPLWPERATIGGVVATNDSGSLRHRYGSLRDLVIGMTIVLADGTIARSGGKVVKNVAGYDLPKLMTGAYGTLGVITEVTFRLHSIPKHTLSLSVIAHEPDVLGALLLKILDSPLSTESVQMRVAEDEFALDVRLLAAPEAMNEQAERLTTMARSLGLTTRSSDKDVWSARERLFDAMDSILVKGTMLPSEIARFSAEVRRLMGRAVTQIPGVMIAAMPRSVSSEVARLREDLEASAGSLTVLRQPADQSLAVWGKEPNTLALMRELKRRFDPDRTLNPGRFIGGI